jgi:hypothetical protein
MKRSSSYKPASSDLASISFSSNLTNQLDLVGLGNTSLVGTSCANQIKQQQLSNNNNKTDTLSDGAVNSYSFNSKSSQSSRDG